MNLFPPALNSVRCRLALVLACATLGLPSCQTASPTSRIAERPAMFQALPEKQKTLVQRGEVAEGMSPDAVWLAWGSPSQKLAAGDGGKSYEMWRYMGLQAIQTHRFTSYGSFHRGRNGRGCYHPGFAYDMGPDYVPYTAAEVKFAKGKVASWERLR